MNGSVRAPKLLPGNQWSGYTQRPWLKKDKKQVTILYSLVERRKSLFMRAFFKRGGYKFIDMGDHIKEDVRWAKEYGNRMECNPMYFTCGSFLRHLFNIERETSMSKDEIAKKYIFLCGGGQCGPCRYGMYPQEYLKAANDAGFKDIRILIFSSELGTTKDSKGHALRFHLPFRINMAISIILSDLLHAAECALRPYADNKAEVDDVLSRAEQMILNAFESRFYLFKLPRVLTRVGKMFAAVERRQEPLPLIFVTGEFFANLAHNDGNYHLRRFIAEEGCEVIPGSFTQRMFYDNWRRSVEAKRGIKYAENEKERKSWEKMLKKQRTSSAVIRYLYNKYQAALNPSSFGARTELMDLDELAETARHLYHPEIFGGEGNLEIAEAIHLADKVDGFISAKPFGCMPSSGVSDGVQAKVTAMYPSLNFLSIETSGDNDVNILSRISMLLLKAKQTAAEKRRIPPIETLLPEVAQAPKTDTSDLSEWGRPAVSPLFRSVP
jgi:predicted nucleotide-binding protein (sugar kinase/HSP70/actin superfamily)